MISLFDRFRSRKPTPIPDSLWAAIVDSLPFLDVLAVDEKKALKSLAEDFLAEKEFTAAGGLELNDEICASIAAQGCLPILKLGLSAYRDWVGIVVYPDEFVVRRRIEDESGVVHEYDDVLSGEAWEGGPLIISWHDVQMAGDGYNVVIHEFAHKLDMLNGEADGMPALHSGIAAAEWEDIFFTAYDDFCQRVDDGGRVDNVTVAPLEPVEAAGGRTLVLLTRRYRTLPAVENRTYIQPSEPIGIGQFEIGDPDGIRAAYELGLRDGAAFASDAVG